MLGQFYKLCRLQMVGVGTQIWLLLLVRSFSFEILDSSLESEGLTGMLPGVNLQGQNRLWYTHHSVGINRVFYKRGYNRISMSF